MYHKPISDLSGKRILVSNDDGINGPGLEVLIGVARTLSDDVWVWFQTGAERGVSQLDVTTSFACALC